MRKLSIFIVIAVIFGALMMSQAYAVEVNQKIPYSQLIPVLCTGESVLFTGTQHIVIDYNIKKSGRLEFIYHSNLMGISGVGVTSGEKYQIAEVNKENRGMNTTDGYPAVFTIVHNLNILGLRLGNVYMVRMLFHCTLNANGEITTEIDNFTVEGDCK